MPAPARTTFLFDLDGTLVDSVYQHVLAWKQALDADGIPLSVWRIHRKIGMSGGLFTNILLRETGIDITPERVERLHRLHAQAYAAQATQIRPLPGAVELLTYLTDNAIPWAIATSGRMETARHNLLALGVDPERNVVITRDMVRYAKPDPDLFLAAADKLGADIEHSVVVGDSIWDLLAARRARALGVGLLSGGYGQDELERAGAFRVYEDPADLLKHIDEVAARISAADAFATRAPRRRFNQRKQAMSSIQDLQARVAAVLALAPVVPVLVIDDLNDAVPLARALVAGGLPAIEVTLRTPVALDAVRAIAAEVEGAAVGVGSVRRPSDFVAALKAGATFAVSPGSSPALIAAAREIDLPWLPGAATASEAMALLEHGYTRLKFFPAESIGGAAALKAFGGPLPELSFCATGGIGAGNAHEYLALKNVPCVGGSWVAPTAAVKAGDWAQIEALARQAAQLKA